MIELKLNIFGTIALLTGLVGLTVGIVFLFYAKTLIHRIWGIFNVSVGSWAFNTFLAATTNNSNLSYLFWKLSHIPGYFIAIIFAHFVIEYCTIKNHKRFIIIGYLYSLVAVLIILTAPMGIFHLGTKYLYNSFYYLRINSIPWILLLTPWSYYLGWALIKFYQHYKESPFPKNKDSSYIITIIILGFLGGMSTFLPMGGYYNFYPYTLTLTLIYELGASYLIFKREILEFDFVIHKSVLYSTLIFSLSLFYLFIIFTADQLLQSTLTSHNLSTRSLAVIIIALAFNPLRNRIQTVIDKTLFKGTPFQLAAENQLLRQTAAQGEKMRVIATLTSGIAHEIKNPLTALKTFFEYYPQKKNDLQFQEKFEKIGKSEINRIENILNDLLTFAKPSPLTLTDTDINKTLQHALNLTSNQLKKNNIELKTEFADNLPLIKADANKLIQVFINLILNAIDAMPNGGRLDIKVTKSPPHMSSPHALSGDPLTKMDSRFRSHTATNVNDKNVYITFADSGCGIPKENLSKIFDPFFSTKDSGTGLGLAIVKGIIEEHGGKIIVTSVQNQGTTFTINLLVQKI